MPILANALRSAPAMLVCRNPPPDFLSYRWRDTRTACALNQGLRSLRSLRNGSHPSLWVKGEIGKNGMPTILGLVRLKWRRGKELPALRSGYANLQKSSSGFLII